MKRLLQILSVATLAVAFLAFTARATTITSVSIDQEPAADYCGNHVKCHIGVTDYSAGDFHPTLQANGKTYAPTSLTPPVSATGTASVAFEVDDEGPNAVMPGNVYEATLSVCSRDFFVTLKQYETETVMEDWFGEETLIGPTNYLPSTKMPEYVTARVEAEFPFTTPYVEPEDEDDDEYPDAQFSYRIVADKANGGYKFQVYSAQAYPVIKTNEQGVAYDDIRYTVGWFDANPADEDKDKVRTQLGETWRFRAEAYYDADASGDEQNTLVCWVKNCGVNGAEFTRIHVGIPFNFEKVWAGQSTSLTNVMICMPGTVYLSGWYEGTASVVPEHVRLGGIGSLEATTSVSNAVTKLKPRHNNTLYLYHEAKWSPSAADLQKELKFENFGLLRVTPPSGFATAWADISGNTATLIAQKALSPEAKTEPMEGVPAIPLQWIREALNPKVPRDVAGDDPAAFRDLATAVPSAWGKATPLWQDYVAGTDPDPNSRNAEFRITSFEIGPDGLPRIGFSPDLGDARQYVIEGKPELSGAWHPATEGDRFFRVTVGIR